MSRLAREIREWVNVWQWVRAFARWSGVGLLVAFLLLVLGVLLVATTVRCASSHRPASCDAPDGPPPD